MTDTVSGTSSDALENLAREDRRFPPSAEFTAQANVDASVYAEADADRVAFWERAAERLEWATKWQTALDWSNPPFAKWFVGGKLNACYNAVDRHVENGQGDKVALHVVPDDGPDSEHAHLSLIHI